MLIIDLIKLIILFAVIFDPMASFAVFFIATKHLTHRERIKTATYAIITAALISFVILVCGNYILTLFNTTMDNFKIAGGIILAMLGIKMTLGQSLTDTDKISHSSGRAIAAIIATPLLTGPASITTIIITSKEYGMLLTGLAVAIVLLITAILFYQAERVSKHLGTTVIQITSTMLGLITIAWGIRFVREGLGI
jgi:multiple antibiotic resistance protein